MAEENALRFPLEIPWKLASTTQPLTAGNPAGTSLSLFFFEPDDENLTNQFPDEKLVYLKVTASVSPADFPAGKSPVAAPFLGEGVPCFHLLLDLKVTTPSGDAGSIRPYFHAAAPLQRRMIQTGVAGADAFEGTSDAQVIGKSGSQLYESLRSQTSTTTGSAGFSLFGFGASVQSTGTDVASNRAVSQVVDSTTRQASEERRELVSHLNRVENVITLLNTKHLGTPHLTFSLSPRPLQMLSIDPSDPNLWFNELLARRSSGIEGIQEFTAVIVVPRDEGFCVQARLRRVCLLDTPPGPLRLDERFTGGPFQLFRAIDYLYRTYPPGTPLEDLDIDIISPLIPANQFRRPVIEFWVLRLDPQVIEAFVVSPGATPGDDHRGSVNYKHFLELWLETLRDEYEQEVARSPLERGMLLGENRRLNTCFATQDDGGFAVTTSSTSVSPLFPIDVRPDILDVGGRRTASATTGRSVRTGAVDTITRWNAAERQVAAMLSNRDDFPETPAGFDDPRIVRVLVDRWEKLNPSDSRNLDFDKAADELELSSEHRRLLQTASVTDLRGIAHALKAAPVIEQQNLEVERVRKIHKDRKLGIAPPEIIPFPVSPKEGQSIQAQIGSVLRKSV